MFKDRRVIIALSVVMGVLLLGLIICERRNPEAGVELMRSLLRR